MSKTCTKCGETKPLDEYCRDRSRKDGRGCWCKECSRKNRNRYYRENRDKELEKQRQYREENRDKIQERDRRYWEENRDKELDRRRRYYEENRDKEADRHRRYHEENRDELREYARRYREENRDILNQGQKMRSAKYTRTSNLLASKKGAPYSPNEDAFLMADNGMSVYQKAVELGRTHESCSSRRKLLRSRAHN